MKMKKLFAAMLVVFMAVGSAYAVDMSVTGDWYVRGTYEDNVSTLGSESGDRTAKMFYDHELTLKSKLTVTDTTNISLNMSVNDVTFDAGNDGTANKTAGTNITVDRLYGTHTFGTGTQFQAGLMAAGEWGYSFGDTGYDAYRVRVNQPVGGGTLVGILEKNEEQASEEKKAENHDKDAYILAWVGNLGNIKVMPLFVYGVDGTAHVDETTDPVTHADADKTDTTTVFDLGVGADHGMLGWEAEVKYVSINFDGTDEAAGTTTDDHTSYGAFGHVYFNMDAIKPGLKLAYGSYDEKDGSFNMGDEYDAGGMYIFGDAIGFGHGNSGGNTTASTIVTLYADYAATEAMSVYGAFAYLMSNADKESAGQWKDATGYEIYLKGAYKITDNVTYDAGIGYASLDLNNDDDTKDPDPVTKIYHRFKIAF
jgi:hypothetical protein